MESPEDQTASLEEIEQALRGLSDEECLKLERYARYQVFRYSAIDPKEVFNEAVDRALDGKRAWPRALPFKIFLCGIIRSVADEYRESAAETVAVPSEETLGVLAASAERPVNSTEQRYLDREIIRAVWDLFDGREDVQALLVGLEGQLSAKEVQKQFNLSPQQYDAARKHFERTIAKRYPKGYRS